MYVHQKCHPLALVHTISHTYRSYSKRVSPRGLPFKSFLTTVNHSSGHYNISGSHRAGEAGRYEETDKQPVLWKYGVWQIERQTSLGATGLELWMTLVCSTGSQTIDHQGYGEALAYCADCQARTVYGQTKLILMIEYPNLEFIWSSTLLMHYLMCSIFHCRNIKLLHW